MEAFVSRACFTEIHLSKSRKHAQRYGSLGFGFERDFVLGLYGNPVFYVKSGQSNVGVNANKVLRYLKDHDSEGEILQEYRTLLAYYKNMNDRGSDELNYYDESEWRITHLTRLENEGRVTVSDREPYLYFLKLEPADIKVLVFPDKETKSLALTELAESYPQVLGNEPICLTLGDCENF